MIPGPIGLALIAGVALASLAIYGTSPLSESVFRPKQGRKWFKASTREDEGFLHKIDEQSIRRNHQPLS
jgi:hypothetical protein